MSTDPIIRAIDVGYGGTKFILDDAGHCQLFPSLAPRAVMQRDYSGVYRRRRTREIHVGGEIFEIGPDTALFDDIPILHTDYIEAPEYRALVYGALEAMHVERVDLLVTGLPVHLHETRWQRLQTLLTGTHIIRPGVQVQVDKVAVVVQPLGGFVAHNHLNGRWVSGLERTTLVIDPGFFTCDWIVTRGMQEVPGLSGSVECGVSAYLRSVQIQLQHKLGAHYTNFHRLDEGLRQSCLRLKGRVVDLEPYRNEADAVIDGAVRAVRNSVGEAQQIDEIVVVGGGGPLFLPRLTAAFPDHPMRSVNDPVFANVVGFQLLGKALLKRRAA